MRFGVIVAVMLMFMGCRPPMCPLKEEAKLENQKWQLASFSHTKMAVPKEAWIRFSDGKYEGHSGCNGMGGEYLLEIDDLSIKSGVSTMMACPDMSLEIKFKKALSEVNEYEIKEDRLVLKKDDKVLLIFTIQ